jgi:hypothetical protein
MVSKPSIVDMNAEIIIIESSSLDISMIRRVSHAHPDVRLRHHFKLGCVEAAFVRGAW